MTDIHRLELGSGDEDAFSLPSAFEWRKAIADDSDAYESQQHGGTF